MTQQNQKVIANSYDKQAPHESNNPDKDGANPDRTYWFAVNIAWVVFVIQMLLFMYLIFGPDFWKEFFK